MTEIPLKPCPFCGGVPQLEVTERLDDQAAPRPHRVYQIVCQTPSCDAQIEREGRSWWSGRKPPESFEDIKARNEVVEAWNRRTVGEIGSADLEKAAIAARDEHCGMGWGWNEVSEHERCWWREAVAAGLRALGLKVSEDKKNG